MHRTLKTLALLTAFTPIGLSAQSGVTASTEAAAAARMGTPAADAAAQARIDAAIRNAASAGVPESLLASKVAEGRAKGVAAARIAAAVEHRAEVLTRVRSAFSDGAAAGELDAAADAHERGVGIDALAQVVTRSGEDRAVALTVLADLVASGRTPGQAVLRVETALSRGGSALVELGSTVAGSARGAVPAVQVGTDAAAAASARGAGSAVSGSVTGATRVRVGG